MQSVCHVVVVDKDRQTISMDKRSLELVGQLLFKT